jgi:hypothetical protein
MRMHLPSYCERGADGLWAEPLNALTNIAFLAAAWLAWRHWRTRPAHGWGRQPDLGALILLVVVIGIGSLLWHTVARPWAYWLDALPIVFFIHLFLLSILRRIAALSWPRVLAVIAAYDGMTLAILAALPAGALNDSAGYLPVVLFMLLLTAWLRVGHHPLWRVLALASGLFVISLLLRIIDPAICDVLPVGTHFLWHVINGVLLYLLLRGLTDHVIPTGGRTP